MIRVPLVSGQVHLTLLKQFRDPTPGRRFGKDALFDQTARGHVGGRRHVLHVFSAPPLEDGLKG